MLESSGLRACWGNFIFLIAKNIRTCLAKQDQAGFYMWGLQLNYDKIYTKEFDLEISNLYDIIYLLFYIIYVRLYLLCFLLYNSSLRDNATYIAYIL